MQVTQLCHKLLLGTTHLKRLNTLSDVVSTSLNFKTLSATQIARKLKGSAKTKSNIRKVDRLLSNEKLLDDVEAIYSAMNRWILTSKIKPDIWQTRHLDDPETGSCKYDRCLPH